MSITVQHDIALKAVDRLHKRMFSTIGNASIRKLRVFQTPKGRHLAILLTNRTLTIVTEPVYAPTIDMASRHKRRYAPGEPRNSNLNFTGSKLGVGNSIDCWVFASLADFEQFCDWYALEQQAGAGNPSARSARVVVRAETVPTPATEPSPERAAGNADADLFSRFRPVLEHSAPPVVRDDRLLMHEDGKVRIYYAPFEYVAPDARVVLVGITPGPTQMLNANLEARRALASGLSEPDAIRAAKDTAAFSGEPMRGNLIRQLNHWGFQRWLGLGDASELFSTARALAQTTSLLRYPVFVDGKDYRGKPDMLAHPLLRDQLMRYFVPEIRQLGQAVLVGLGPVVQRVLDALVTLGLLEPDRVIRGMLHPSGQNTYRITYLTGDRVGPIPHATTPHAYDQGRHRFQEQYL